MFFDATPVTKYSLTNYFW